MAIAVFWRKDVSGWRVAGERETCKPECDDADDVHEDVTALAKDNGVQRNERLRRAEGEKCVGVRLEL